MNLLDLVSKRALLKVTTRGGYRGAAVEEYRVLEVSPSGQWTRLRNIHGSQFWVPVVDVSFVEELRDLRAERMQERRTLGEEP